MARSTNPSPLKSPASDAPVAAAWAGRARIASAANSSTATVIAAKSRDTSARTARWTVGPMWADDIRLPSFIGECIGIRRRES